MHSVLALGLLAFAGLSAAQKEYTIDPSTVSPATRDYWCTMEKTQCPLICLQQPGVTTSATVSNDCDPDALTYACVCDDGSSPNITKYTQTLPYFTCTEFGNQCVSNCNNDNTCADKCRSDNPCGAQDPVKPNATSSSSSTTASATASQSGGSTDTPAPTVGFAGATNTPQPGAASAMLNLGASCGWAITFAGVLAGFALL